MIQLSRFLRALSPMCAALAVGAATLGSGHPALAKTPFFGEASSSHKSLPDQSRDAFVRVGLAATPIDSTTNTSPTTVGGFSNLLGSTTPKASGWRLTQATNAVFSFQTNPVSVSETARSVTLTVTRSGNTTGTSTVNYTTSNGQATEPADYTKVGSFLTFTPGQTSKSITIPIIDDNIVEGPEDFFVTLSSPPGTTNQTFSNSPARVVITDNDSEIQLNAPTVNIDEAAGNVLVTVVRKGIEGSSRVDYKVDNGTATNGQDYTSAATGQITFPIGVDSVDIRIPITNDRIVEGDEDFTVTLTGASTVTGTGTTVLGLNTVTKVIIQDNDSTTVGLTSATYQVNEGTPTFVIPVTRPNTQTNDVSREITVDYEITNGSAVAPQDYAPTAGMTGTLTFAANVQTQNIEIPILADTLAEATETFTVTLSNPLFTNPPTPNAEITIAPFGTTTVSIIDTNSQVNFTTATYTVAESVGTLLVPVTRRLNTGVAATVDYATSNITAIGGQDYTITTGTLTFAAGETTKNIPVPIINDPSDEDAESFRITLSNPSPSTAIGPTSVTTITITDDDDIPTITVDDVQKIEGDFGQSNLAFTVTLSAPSGRTLSLRYATSDGSATVADNDYISTSSTLTIPVDPVTGVSKDDGIGANKRVINVPIVGDTKFEGDEAFILTLSNATNSTLITRKATGTIVNDDAAPASAFNFSPVQPSVTESAGQATLTITRTGDTTYAASVTVKTANETAIAGADYTAVSTVVSFPANVTSRTVPVSIFNDSVNEADETFTATLSAPTTAIGVVTLGANPVATVTILDDDADPTLTLSPASVREGDSGTVDLTFVATIPDNQSSEQTLTVQYATVDGTATIADNDYIATSGTLSFAPGDHSKTITVKVIGDTTIEPNETLSLVLTNPQNLTLSNTTATGTIINDDTPPTFSNLAFTELTKSVSEAAGSVTLTVRRTTGTDRVATINYATVNGTATAGADFTATSGTLTFAIGQTTANIVVPIINDTLQELGGPENFKVKLSNVGGNGVLPTQDTATISIVDNEGAPTLSVANTDVLEGNSGITSMIFTVSLFPQSQSTVKVQIATTTTGTAISSGRGQDYRPGSALLTFTPGQATKTFTVSVIGDTIVEPDETVNVLLSAPQGAPLANSGKTAVGTIINDDEPGGGGTITFLSASYSVNEDVMDNTISPANSAKITLGRSGKIDQINQQSATVRFTTGTGTATSGKDYRAVNTVVTFPAGETTVTVLVPIIDDATYESDETLSLSISEPSNNAILGSITTANLTIADDDPKSSVPRLEALTPNALVGSPFTVSSSYSSDLGINDLSPVIIQFGGNINGNGFRAIYYPATNLLSINPGTGQQVRPGTRTVLTNQFGSLDVSKTTVQRSGNTLTVSWNISLTSKTAQYVYMGATSTSGENVFVKRGTWQPAAAATRSSTSGS
ncbi:hypothetical protein EON83_11950 [bacterium]|nr:MAG: hypothetical protein EON83_11950 [bacterium]